MNQFFTLLNDHPIVGYCLLAMLVVGFWGYMQSKGGSFEDYALASKSLPAGVLVMTLLGTYVTVEGL